MRRWAAERHWRELTAEGKTVSFITIGKKGKEYLTRRGATIAQDFPKPYEGLDLAKATFGESGVSLYTAAAFSAKPWCR